MLFMILAFTSKCVTNQSFTEKMNIFGTFKTQQSKEAKYKCWKSRKSKVAAAFIKYFLYAWQQSWLLDIVYLSWPQLFFTKSAKNHFLSPPYLDLLTTQYCTIIHAFHMIIFYGQIWSLKRGLKIVLHLYCRIYQKVPQLRPKHFFAINLRKTIDFIRNDQQI
jgi:hypothetical protein